MINWDGRGGSDRGMSCISRRPEEKLANSIRVAGLLPETQTQNLANEKKGY
jgi:hypothetical protein